MKNAPALTSTLDKYVRVPPPKEDTEGGSKTEIKITQKQPRVAGYVVYATKLLVNENEDSVTIKAAGNAAPKGVLVAEILRHRIPNLHQINKVTHVEVVDTWQPLEEGLDTVIDTKILPVLEIRLTKKPTDSELKDVSYQAPIPTEQLEKVDLENFGKRGGGKKTGEPRQKKEGETQDETGGEEGRKRRRNRNRNRRGPGRGGNRGAPRGGDDRDYDRLEDEGEVFKQPAPFSDNKSNRRGGRRQGNQNQDRGQDNQDGGRRQGDNRNAGGNRVRLDKMPNLRKDPGYSGHGGSKHQGDKYEDLRRDDEGYGGGRRQGGGNRRDDDYGDNRRQGGNRGGNRRDNEGYDDRRQGGDNRGGNRRDDQGYGDNRRQGGDNRGGNRRDDQGYDDRRQGVDNRGGNRRDDQGYGDNRRQGQGQGQGQGQRREEGRGQDRVRLGDSSGLRRDPGHEGHGSKIQGDKYRDLVHEDRRQGDNRGGNRRDNEGYDDNRRRGNYRGGNRRDQRYGEEEDWEDYDRPQQRGGQQGNRDRGQNDGNKQRYDDDREDRGEEQRNFRGGFGRGRARLGRGLRGVPRGGYSTRGGY